MQGGSKTETFIAKIMNRQNSTWQGTITWVDEHRTQNFRSALELIKLIEESEEPRRRFPEKKVSLQQEE